MPHNYFLLVYLSTIKVLFIFSFWWAKMLPFLEYSWVYCNLDRHLPWGPCPVSRVILSIPCRNIISLQCIIKYQHCHTTTTSFKDQCFLNLTFCILSSLGQQIGKVPLRLVTKNKFPCTKLSLLLINLQSKKIENQI